MQRQVHLLRAFAKHAPLMIGRTAMMFLPGHGQKFIGPRRINGQRPVCVTLEVKPEGGLVLAGAIARNDNGKMKYRVIFRYDLTQPMRKGASGAALDSGKNPVLANVACDLLQELVRFAERNLSHLTEENLAADTVQWPRLLVAVPRDESVFDNAAVDAVVSEANAGSKLIETTAASVQRAATAHLAGVHLVDAQFVKSGFVMAALKSEAAYEDFEPVLRAGYWNPSRLLLSAANPAKHILEKRGLSDDWHATLDDGMVGELIAEMRAGLPVSDRYTDDELLAGLMTPEKPVPCAMTLAQFIEQDIVIDPVTFAEFNPQKIVVEAMRGALKRAVAAQATDEDLLEAAKAPGQPLYLTRRCAVQIVMNEQLTELPAHYTGTVLPDAAWQPAPAKQPRHFKPQQPEVASVATDEAAAVSVTEATETT